MTEATTINNAACNCEESKFINMDHKHIVTGDLNIINNRKLMNIFAKGPNYREKQSLNWTLVLKEMKLALNKYVEKISNQDKKDKSLYQQWVNTVLEKVQTRIQILRKTKFKRWQKNTSIFKDKEVKKELEDLKERFAIVLIDKASNNIGFICKKYYQELLNKEVGSETYELVNSNKEEIIEKIKTQCAIAGIKLDLKNYNDLPYIYPTIKMHKNPVKFRYIISACKSVLKPIAQTLTKVLKLVLNTHKRYCQKVFLYTGINRMWIADNSRTTLNMIDDVNRRKSARNVSTHDFSTLYTKIPLDDLKTKLKNVIDKAFKGGQKQHVLVSKFNAAWYGKSEKDNVYTKQQIYSMIDILIDNLYFQMGDRIYRQRIGIPMGVDPAPYMANIYLYHDESKFLEKMTKENYSKAKKYNKIQRYIDDLFALNNDGNLETDKEDIYHTDLQLNKENVDDKNATFLDLDISVTEKTISTKTYDKREAFAFDIVSYPDLSGNVPRQQAYGVCTAQIVRHASNCTHIEDFINRCTTLMEKLMHNNYNKNTLDRTMEKTLDKNRWILQKYNCNREKLKKMMKI